MENKYQGIKVEFHILQSFPVTCLNRDDVGAPKSALIGGAVRARVSSQAWKRQVRLALHEFGIKLAVRTKHVSTKIANYCLDLGAEEEKAIACGETIAAVLTKDTLHFFSDTEAEHLAKYAEEVDFEAENIEAKEVIKRHKKSFSAGIDHLDGLDIALFGRMVAQAAELNIQAASSFSHAISTHKATSEVEFFTALDDQKPLDDFESGSSHMGSLEFNSATYYRYVSLDIGQLANTLGTDEHLNRAIDAFIKALYVAVPFARQNTQAGYNLWDYAKVFVRRGQNIQASFEEPIKSTGEGFLKPSIKALDNFLEKKEKLSGSLFGRIAQFDWGFDDSFTIDSLISGVQNALRS